MGSLFDFGNSTGADLEHIVSTGIAWREMVSSTMPTSSYSILMFCPTFRNWGVWRLWSVGKVAITKDHTECRRLAGDFRHIIAALPQEPPSFQFFDQPSILMASRLSIARAGHAFASLSTQYPRRVLSSRFPRPQQPATLIRKRTFTSSATGR